MLTSELMLIHFRLKDLNFKTVHIHDFRKLVMTGRRGCVCVGVVVREGPGKGEGGEGRKEEGET